MTTDPIWSSEEQAVFALRGLYQRYGYAPYKMSQHSVAWHCIPLWETAYFSSPSTPPVRIRLFWIGNQRAAHRSSPLTICRSCGAKID